MKVDITIIGAGNLGTALAHALRDTDIGINEIVTQKKTKRLLQLAKHVGASLVDFNEARLDARVLWITTPDSAIMSTAKAIVKATSLHRQVVLHSSGVLPSAALGSAREAGAATGSLHPMMSFPRPSAVSLRGVGWAVEGETPATKIARHIIKKLGGIAIQIGAKRKPLHHALGTLSSPLLVSLLTAADSVARRSGLSQREARALMRPIIERTVANFFEQGPEASFSGPFERGDLETVALHLRALNPAPPIAAAYRALALHALASLPVANREAIRKLLHSTKLRASKPVLRASGKSVRN